MAEIDGNTTLSFMQAREQVAPVRDTPAAPVPATPAAATPEVAGTARELPGVTDSSLLVEELLQSLLQPEPEPPERTSTGRRVIGSIGDALSAFAAIRSGGQALPVGAFTAGQRQKQQAFQDELSGVRDTNADTARQVKILKFKNELAKKLKLTGGKKDGPQGPVPETGKFIDEEGNIFFGAARRIAGGQLGDNVQLLPVQPGQATKPVGLLRSLSQGLSTKIGLGGVFVFNPATGTLSPLLAGEGASAVAGGGQGAQFQPRPRTEDVRKGGFVLSVLDNFNTIAELAPLFAEKDSSTIAANIKQLIRVGETGRSIVGQLDPELELLQSTKELIGEQIAFLVTGQQMGEQQAQRLINQMPDSALLTTKNGRRTFAAKLAKMQRFFLTMVKTTALTTPVIFDPEVRNEILNTPLPSITDALRVGFGDKPKPKRETTKDILEELEKKSRAQEK